MHAGVSAMNSCFTMPPSVAADKSLGDTKTGSALLSDVYCTSHSELHVHQISGTKRPQQCRNMNSDFCVELVKVIMSPLIGNESIG